MPNSSKTMDSWLTLPAAIRIRPGSKAGTLAILIHNLSLAEIRSIPEVIIKLELLS